MVFTITQRGATAILVSMLFTTALSGCFSSPGPDLGQVTGRVTLDGAIVQGAILEFIPASGRGSLAYGQTDANGEYKAEFTGTRSGAMLGVNKVRITSGEPVIWKSQTFNDRPDNMRELFPRRYNRASDLECTVEKGSNICNFECTNAK